jgi:hypothetical protein
VVNILYGKQVTGTANKPKLGLLATGDHSHGLLGSLNTPALNAATGHGHGLHSNDDTHHASPGHPAVNHSPNTNGDVPVSVGRPATTSSAEVDGGAKEANGDSKLPAITGASSNRPSTVGKGAN